MWNSFKTDDAQKGITAEITTYAAGDGDQNHKNQRCCAYPEHFQ